jgi:hypothetical protein
MTCPRKIVVLSGWLQSGKDTVGKILVDRFGYKRYAFADALKDELSQVLNVPRSVMDTNDGKMLIVQGQTVRQHLIEYGQEQRRKDPLVWVKKVCQKISREGEPLVVITDWRMPNEVQGIVDFFKTESTTVMTCRIDRWDTPPLQDYTEVALDEHEFDLRIANKTDLETLENMVCQTLGNECHV